MIRMMNNEGRKPRNSGCYQVEAVARSSALPKCLPLSLMGEIPVITSNRDCAREQGLDGEASYYLGRWAGRHGVA